jgi:hypothetical protein
MSELTAQQHCSSSTTSFFTANANQSSIPGPQLSHGMPISVSLHCAPVQSHLPCFFLTLTTGYQIRNNYFLNNEFEERLFSFSATNPNGSRTFKHCLPKE